MYSNRAVPKYYGEFRDKVIRGEIPVCREIAMEMGRIDQLIADERYYYDSYAVEGFISFVETELTLTDGSRLKMLPAFKLWAEELFGWYYYIQRSFWYEDPNDPSRSMFVTKWVKQRLITKQFIITARGAAKTMYSEFVQGFFLVVDPSTTQQVTTAPTMRQADELMGALRTAITRAHGPVFKFLTLGSLQNTTGNRANRPKLVATKKGIENFMTNSILEVRPMTIDKLQGLRCKIATVDEWLSGETREDVFGALEQGASKNQDYIILATSSEGTVRNGVGDDIKLELMSILKGEYNNPRVSIWWYKLDDVMEVGNPQMWIKANPNLGVTVSYETYNEDVKKAENNPAARNDILAKRFGLPMEGHTYFFTYEETLCHSKAEYWGMICSMGADLSQGDDFCAFAWLFPLPGNTFGVKVRSYISEVNFRKLPPATKIKYNEFLQEGSLIIMEGVTLDMMDVYDDLDNHIQHSRYDIRAFGYDPYNAKGFVDRYMAENSPYGVEKVIQGVKTESVPLGEIKHLVQDHRMFHDEALMQYAMGNAIVLEDTNGNRKLWKRRHEAKIDNVAALMDAWVAYKANIQNFE